MQWGLLFCTQLHKSTHLINAIYSCESNPQWVGMGSWKRESNKLNVIQVARGVIRREFLLTVLSISIILFSHISAMCSLSPHYSLLPWVGFQDLKCTSTFKEKVLLKKQARCRKHDTLNYNSHPLTLSNNLKNVWGAIMSLCSTLNSIHEAPCFSCSEDRTASILEVWIYLWFYTHDFWLGNIYSSWFGKQITQGAVDQLSKKEHLCIWSNITPTQCRDITSLENLWWALHEEAIKS